MVLVFTDIQGSTRLWEKSPDAMREALALHDACLRDALARHDGYEVKTEGDAFMVAFVSPAAAVRWCLDAQLALSDTTWPPALAHGIRVRMGAHVGEPVCRPDALTGRMDYFGPVVNRAARVQHAAHGGQLLCTGALWDAVAGEIAGADVLVEELGTHRLKDLAEGERLVQVLPRRLGPQSFPPLRTEGVLSARPWRGLESYEAADAGLFFGREAECRRLEARVRERTIVTVTGASGAGKTSLLQTGLAAALPDHVVLYVRPGRDPLASVRRALATVLGVAPAEGGEVRAADLRIVLVVDQCEELFTVCPDEATRRAFATFVVAFAGDPCRLVLVVREEFFTRLATLPALGAVFAETVEVIVPPGRDALREAVVRPAELFGYQFEDERLPDEMIAAVEGEPAALPLLQTCADRLWDRRDPVRRLLTRQAYREIGGIAGALAHHADEVVEALAAAQQREARDLLRRLVTPEGTRAVVAVRELARSDAAGHVLERLVAARLVAIRDADGGEPVAELVHEALVRHWDRLARWLAEDRASHELHQAMRAATRDWLRRDRLAAMLWRGDLLRDLSAARLRAPEALSPEETAFVRASIAAEERARRARRSGLWLAGSALAWFGIVMSAQWRLSASAYEDARVRALVGEALAASAAHRGNDAVALLRLASVLDPAQSEMTVTLSELSRLSWREVPHREVPLGSPIAGLAFDGTGTLAVATGTGGRRLDLRTGEARVDEVEAGEGWRQGAPAGACADATAWMAAGPYTAVRCGETGVELHDGGGAVLRERLPGGAIDAAASDGARLALGTRGGVVHLWPLDGLRRAGPVAAEEPGDPVLTAPVADPPRTLVARAGARLEAWTLGEGPSIAWTRDTGAEVRDLSVHPQGQLAVATTADGRAAVWQVRTGLVLADLDAAALFAADGSLVAAGRAWPFARPRRAELVPATGARTNVRVCPDSARTIAVVPWPDAASVEAPPEACR